MSGSSQKLVWHAENSQSSVGRHRTPQLSQFMLSQLTSVQRPAQHLKPSVCGVSPQPTPQPPQFVLSDKVSVQRPAQHVPGVPVWVVQGLASHSLGKPPVVEPALLPPEGGAETVVPTKGTKTSERPQAQPSKTMAIPEIDGTAGIFSILAHLVKPPSHQRAISTELQHGRWLGRNPVPVRGNLPPDRRPPRRAPPHWRCDRRGVGRARAEATCRLTGFG
jgi:hypothetical protein